MHTTVNGQPGRFLILLCSLMALSAAAAPAERREIRLPDLPGLQTLACDFHMHTVFSDGNVWPTWRVEEAWRDGLDAIALTDHVEYTPKKDDVPPQPNRPFELARGTGLDRGIIVIRGAEVTKAVPPGHFNALFLTNVVPLGASTDVSTQLQAARAQDAFVFWNHPGWQVKPGQPIRLPLHDELCAQGLVGGFEIYNGDDVYTNEWPWAGQHNLTLVGNSDTHEPMVPPGPGQAGHRTMTLVLARERSEAGIKEALCAGRTAVWAGNLLAGRADVVEPLVKACLRLDPPHVRQAKKVMVHLHNDSDLALKLTRTSGPGPATIELPAGATVLLKLTPADAQAALELAYAADNVLTGPGAPLPLRWSIPAAAAGKQ